MREDQFLHHLMHTMPYNDDGTDFSSILKKTGTTQGFIIYSVDCNRMVLHSTKPSPYISERCAIRKKGTLNR